MAVIMASSQQAPPICFGKIYCTVKLEEQQDCPLKQKKKK
jgi:hypothetical protein